jgi:adenylate cyclase
MDEQAHILIVEDDTMIRRVYHDVLVADGYRVSLAGSGEEALAYLHLITPDLILLDLALPGIDGTEVIRRLKQDTSKPFIPVIMLSAQADLTISISSLDAGADDFLVKPVELDELLAHVRAMLRLQRSQRSLSKEQRKTELLLHLTRDLGASIEIEVLLTRFLDHLADAVGAIRASIILTGLEAGEILYFSSSRRPAVALGSIVQNGVAGWVLREQAPLLIIDTRDDPRWVNLNEQHTSVRSVAAMPVMREQRVLGVITLVHHTPGFLSDDHLDLLKSVAAQSAVALESAQLFSLVQRQSLLLERRADELRRINEINAFLSELMQPDQVMRLLVHMIRQQFSYPLVSILTYEGEDLVMQAAAGSLNGMEHFEMVRFRADRGLNSWALHKRQPVRVDDVRLDDRFADLLPDDDLVRSEMVVPIVLRREVLGTIDVRSPQVAAFSANDEAVLSAISSQFSIALGNARLLELEQQRIAQLSQVNRLSVAITAQLDAPQNLQVAADAVAIIFGVAQAGLILFGEPEQQNAVLVALHGVPQPRDSDFTRFLLENADVQTRVAALREPLHMRGLQQEECLRPLQDFLASRTIDAVLVVPLLASGRSLGALCVDASRRPEGFARADLELATTVASLIVQVIENARLYRVVADERSTLDAVLRGANDPILLIGPEDELLLANRAAEERLGISIERQRGRALDSLPGPYANTFLRKLVPLLASIDENDDAVELELPEDITYSVSVAPVRSADDQLLGRVAVLRDISATKRLERQERERVRSVFRRYVSPVVAERLLSAGQEIGRPTEDDVAVMVSDLRGFTTLTERTDPHVLIERILNRYFRAMTEVLYAHDATIDKFLGDGIIGVFGTPIARADDPQRALVTAVAMQQAFAELQAEWRSELGLDIGMGIGISYGRAVIGNIGSLQRQDYTLIGDVVNTASRLSGIARAGKILLSYHLVEAFPTNWQLPYPLEPIGEVELKGKQEPHLVYEVKYM